MDKAKTLPRSKRDKSPSPSSSSFSSLKNATHKISPFRGLKKKKKKDAEMQPLNGGTLTETPELDQVATPEDTAATLDAVVPTEKLKTPKKPKPPIKRIVQGGKGLLTRFKGKNESAPIMVDGSLDARRSARQATDEEKDEQATIEEELKNGDITEVTVPRKDEWSTTATCEKVRKLSRLEIHESVYNEELDGEGLPSPTTPEDEAFVDDENLSAEPVTANGTGAPINFDKKSPSTIKKEILSSINSSKIRKTSDPISNGSRSTVTRKVSMQVR